MPLHRIYSPAGTLSTEEKALIAKNLTKFYTERGLPPFYVNVFYIDVPKGIKTLLTSRYSINLFVEYLPPSSDSFYVGGEQRTIVRVVSQHLAR